MSVNQTTAHQTNSNQAPPHQEAAHEAPPQHPATSGGLAFRQRSAYCRMLLRRAWVWSRSGPLKDTPDSPSTIRSAKETVRAWVASLRAANASEPRLTQSGTHSVRREDHGRKAGKQTVRTWIASLRTANAAERRLTQLEAENVKREDRGQAIYDEFYSPQAAAAQYAAPPAKADHRVAEEAPSRSTRPQAPAVRFGLLGLTAILGFWVMAAYLTPQQPAPQAGELLLAQTAMPLWPFDSHS